MPGGLEAMFVLWWLLRRVVRLTVDLIIVLLVFTLLPGIPPHVPVTKFEELPPPLPLEGALAKNNILDTAERVLDGNIVGPESIASRDPEEIFVSLHGGKILRIWGPSFDHYKVAASIGPGCDAPWKEEVCGRPLGLRFSPDGKLLVADAYLGLFSLDVDTGEKESLFDVHEEIEGFAPKIPDDLDVDSEGYIYWSDASYHEGLYKSLIEFLGSPSGRLIRFDPRTKTNTVLVKDLHFANGVQLSPDHSAVLVCETLKNRVHRHWLRGPQAGQTEIFVDKLPGLPDNIRSNGKGGYYISLVSVFSESNRKVNEILGKLPLVRKLILRLMYVTRVLLEAVASFDSSRFIEKMAYKILGLDPVITVNLGSSNQSVVVEVDGDGKILGSLQGHSGRLLSISETQRVGRYMFFGSPFSKYLGRLLVGEPLIEVEGKGVRMKTEEEVTMGLSEQDKEREAVEEKEEIVHGEDDRRAKHEEEQAEEKGKLKEKRN